MGSAAGRPQGGRPSVRPAPRQGSQRRRRRRPWGEEELRHPAAREDHGGPRPDERTCVGTALPGHGTARLGVARVLAWVGSRGPIHVGGCATSMRTAGRGGDGSVRVVDADADQGEGRQQERRDDRGAPRSGERERQRRQANGDGGRSTDHRYSDDECPGDERAGRNDRSGSHVVATERGDSDPLALIQMSSAQGVRTGTGRQDAMTHSPLHPRR